MCFTSKDFGAPHGMSSSPFLDGAEACASLPDNSLQDRRSYALDSYEDLASPPANCSWWLYIFNH